MPKLKQTPKYRYAVELVRRLKRARHEAFLVGGCVRDLLREVPPQDFDIATSARPEEVQKLFKRTVPIGIRFGVVLVLKGKISFEVATFRTDQAYKDGRHPEGVVFSSPKEDALRRDFTVNGLFYDPVRGRVIDYVKGKQDLKARLIRAIGDPARRFEEDRLRVLRAVRFAAVLGFEIEPKTFRAVQKFSPRIQEVSAERIRDELVKLFTGADPVRGLALLDESGLLKVILPEVSKMKGVQQPPEFHPEGDVYTHTALLFKKLKNPSLVLAFGALLHDIGKPSTFKVAERIRFDGHDRVGAAMTEEICRRLRFSNTQTQAIAELVGDHMRFKDVRKMRESTLKRFMGLATFADQLKLHRADCLASHGDLSNWRFLRDKQKALPPTQLRPAPLINGHDLLELGFSAGPVIGTVLRAVQDRQLEGELTSKTQALQWVQKQFPFPQRGSNG